MLSSGTISNHNAWFDEMLKLSGNNSESHASAIYGLLVYTLIGTIDYVTIQYSLDFYKVLHETQCAPSMLNHILLAHLSKV